jgi:hypothetical protein
LRFPKKDWVVPIAGGVAFFAIFCAQTICETKAMNKLPLADKIKMLDDGNAILRCGNETIAHSIATVGPERNSQIARVRSGACTLEPGYRNIRVHTL